jgi:hypothetical protein
MASRAAERAHGCTARRALLAAGALVAVVLLLVAAGRWERSRWIDNQVRGMERIRALVGPLDQPALSGYRRLPGFDCLVYRRGSNPYALELCADPVGRLVEAIDRRTMTRHISSLRSDPTASTVRLDRAEVDRVLRKMGVRTRCWSRQRCSSRRAW